jgi:hypothetical protein
MASVDPQSGVRPYAVYPDARPDAEDFVELGSEADRLHFDSPDAPVGDPAWTETVYLGFAIPEKQINGQIYSWMHPTQRTASGGVFIWRGMTPTWLGAEHYDYRMVQEFPTSDLDDIDFGNGLTMQFTHPLEEIDVQYASPDGKVNLTLNYRAIMPAAGRLDNKHLAQTMKVTGDLVMHGERHDIDSYFTRDRSWNQTRPEAPHAIPPLSWGAATFGDDLSFHFVGWDHHELNPEWAADYPAESMPDTLRWGWVWRDGQLRALRSMRKITRRGSDGISPIGAEIEVTDSTGETYRMIGRTTALLPHPAFPNLLVQWALMEYEIDGRSGYGDYQDCMYHDYVRRYAKAGRP